MRRIWIALVALLFLPVASRAQSKPFTTLSVTAKVISLSGNDQADAAADLAGTMNLSKSSTILVDSIQDSASEMQLYLGGVEYNLPAKWTPSLSAQHFQLFVTGGAGVVRFTPTNAPTTQHIAEDAGVGFNAPLTSSGNFAIGALIRWIHAPGAPGGANFAEVAFGPSISF